MHKPAQFYTHQQALHQEVLTQVKSQLNTSSLLRLLIFIALCIGVYLSWSQTYITAALVILGIVSFLLLVSRHNKLKYKRDLTQKSIDRCTTELKVLQRDFLDLPSGENFKNPDHYYSHDIDLFGRGSFYQYLNRTSLESGANLLAQLLQANAIDNIPKKQEAIKELAALAEWRLRFGAIAQLVKTEIASPSVNKWLKNYIPFIPKGIRVGAYAFSVGSLLMITLYFTGVISGWLLFGWFSLGLAITGRFLKKINTLSAHATQIQNTFTQFYKLLDHIEQQPMECTLLKEKRALIISEKQQASQTLKQFSKLLDAFDQRQNMLIGVLTNGFLLRDLYIVHHIESWIATHQKSVKNWFEIIAFFDAYNSLGNYAFNHPEHNYPEITDSTKRIHTKAAGHPLLDPENCVLNDMSMVDEQFYIVTGANMAGKSTFLRTVALHIVMANMGLPICAKEASYHPIKLITSMRTTDSLTDDESYFYSELKRLKFIVDQIEEDHYFIILDEILKGTNSTDKAIGSRKFIDKLVASKSTGIIATHDLSLTEAATDLVQVKNYFFDAQIINNELYFDYTLKEGVCQNMNASFLLKKMKIVD